jgi:GT2 family glycosyltransferase
MKIAIGAPTYNDSERIRDLFTTLTSLTEGEYSLVMLDDGTKGRVNHPRLKMLSEEFDIPFIRNEKNEGIPYSWNRLTEYHEDADIVVLFNDDIQICSSEWLKNMVYFLENNEKAGAVGLPLIHIDPNTGKRNTNIDLPNQDCQPGRVGCPVGCAFAFKKKLWAEIKQNDGSFGFWESLISFYEELDFGFELAKMGYASYMMPTPACEHWGSMTFASNSNLSVRPIIDYLPRDEYIDALSSAEDDLALPLKRHKELADTGNAFRMDYSRVMFAKKWGCMDKVKHPQAEVHKRLVDVMPKQNIKWIDKAGQEQEALI